MHAPIATRINQLKTRIDDTLCRAATRILIDTMTRYFDVEAIPHLLDLLTGEDDDKAFEAMRALVRYGDSAEAALLDHIASRPSAMARVALERVQYRIRYLQIVGH